MKNLLIVTTLLLSTCIVSCSGRGENTTTTDDTINDTTEVLADTIQIDSIVADTIQ